MVLGQPEGGGNIPGRKGKVQAQGRGSTAYPSLDQFPGEKEHSLWQARPVHWAKRGQVGREKAEKEAWPCIKSS